MPNWFCANQARKDGLDYYWIDTCCINKESSAKLSEAINPMYRWYCGAEVCYIYLSDIEKPDWKNEIANARWFKRGWTLQELLAPAKAIFYDRQWQRLGTKNGLAELISSITQIPAAAIKSRKLAGCSVAQRMSWAAGHVTTRVEDGAYCLLGLFEVHMPLIYGEGQRAFFRLQEEIIKHTDDHSIFAWSMHDLNFSGLLAPSRAYFSKCQFISQTGSLDEHGPFAMTNRGLSIGLRITPWAADTYLAYLDCTDRSPGQNTVPLGIFLRHLAEDDQYTRIKLGHNGLLRRTSRVRQSQETPAEIRPLSIRQILSTGKNRACLNRPRYGFSLAGSWLPPSTRIHARNPSSDFQSAILLPGQWGAVLVLEFSSSEYGNLQQAALGFDFDFNPVCLLRDSWADPEEPDFVRDAPDDWSHLFMEPEKRKETREGDRAFSRDDHRGLLILASHRLEGLDACLYDNPFDDGVTFLLKWNFRIDSLQGHFGRRHFGD